jgi:hypothetical protein
MPVVVVTTKRRGAVTAATDPYFSYVTLLVGAEGADASTSFLDESAQNHALTAGGNAQIDTADFKFGASSYLGDGSGDSVVVGNPNQYANFDFRTGDFTIEAWVNGTLHATNNKGIIGRGPTVSDNSSFYFYMGTTGLPTFWCRNGVKVQGAASISANGWHHVAVTRNSVTTRMFVDGVVADTQVDVSAYDITATTTDQTYIGSLPTDLTTRSWNGWIDEVRVTNGIARYIGNFTPPTAAFPRS